MTFFLHILGHEMRLILRQKSETASLVLFFAIVMIMMPFALGPDPELLRHLAPGLIWIAIVLLCLLALDRLFVQDARDGTLDALLLAPTPLEISVFAKILAQTLVTVTALLFMSVITALFFSLTNPVLLALILTIVLGVPSIILLGGIASALTVSLHRHTALLTLLLIPFYIPILIFAVSACDVAASGGSAAQPLLFLMSILALLLPSAPLIVAASLRS